MQRRQVLRFTGAALTGLSFAARTGAEAASAASAAGSGAGSGARLGPLSPEFAPPPTLAAIRARPDRLIDISVCTRPFRAQGPRLESERLHGKIVVHHYGHGGSGWSLSWGSAKAALPLILAPRQRQIAVVGCGAIGLTTARVAQRAGLRVRIYCKDMPPQVRSSLATGVWSPDSRVCTSEFATLEFMARWEAMARTSFKVYQTLLGLPGDPVEWRDGFFLSDVPFDQEIEEPDRGEPEYPELENLTRDLRPRSIPLDPGEHPFRVPYVRRFTQLQFNLASYQRLLLEDFLREGGELVQREFRHPREFGSLREYVIVNCTGYGARALLGDTSITPVRGQTARLVPQPEVNYGLYWRGHNLSVVSRRDGILVQAQGEHDFGNHDDVPDRAMSEAAVTRLASLFG